MDRSPERYRAVLEPRRLLRWIYVGRVALATAIFGAALLVTLFSDPLNTFITTVTFVSAMALTAVSFVRTEVNGREAGPAFLYIQFAHDLVLITAVVHVTGGPESNFTALYILAYAAAALLLPIGSSLLLALLGSVLFFGDAVLVTEGHLSFSLVLQLLVFTTVAVGTAYIASRLQEAGQGREELRAELADTRLRAADILANIRAAILTVDDAGRLLYANPLASSMLGPGLEERLGAPVLTEIRTAAPAVADAIATHIEGHGDAIRREGTLVLGGRAIPIGISTTSVSGDLTATRRATTVIVQDISDEKRVETLRLRAQRLEAVAALSASLAHEIKNPLASIRSAVEQMSRRAAATADEVTLGSLIVRESDRLARLLSEFLDFARVQVARRDPLDLRAIIRGAGALAATHPDRAGAVELDLRVPDEPVVIAGDEDLLHRALFNLILNAFQAVGETGRVTAQVRALSRAAIPRGVPFTGPAAELVVRDSGPGIPPEIADRLFEPFATTKPGGSGLGLAIVHRAIEAHRGVILVDTSASGTAFTVLFPTDPEPPRGDLA